MRTYFKGKINMIMSACKRSMNIKMVNIINMNTIINMYICYIQICMCMKIGMSRSTRIILSMIISKKNIINMKMSIILSIYFNKHIFQ